MPLHQPSHAAAAILLKARVEELLSRCKATSRFQGGFTFFHEELGIFRDLPTCQSQNLQLLQIYPLAAAPISSRPPTTAT
jgi:hypothetical protein